MMNKRLLLWFMLLMSMLAFVPMATTTNTETINAVLSATYEDEGIQAHLFAVGIDEQATITIALTDETGAYYILPATKIANNNWQVLFPIETSRAQLVAYVDSQDVARISISEAPTIYKQDPTPEKETTITVEETPKEIAIEKETEEHTPILENVEEKLFDIPQKVSLETLKVTDKVNKREATLEKISTTKVRVRPQELPIKEIIIHSFDENASRGKALRLGKPTILDEELRPYTNVTEKTVQTYAIDPEALTFSNATVTVTAQGTRLFKCAEWNFDTETCNGEWKLHKTGLVPGENYTISVTPDDPAYAETTVLAMEWGYIENLDESWQTIDLLYNYADPIIIVTPHYLTRTVSVTSRITAITPTSFQVMMQKVSAFGASDIVNASYLVVEAGNWTLPGGAALEAGSYTSTYTAENNDWTSETLTYINSYTTPVVLSQVMSYNDPRWSSAWTDDGSNNANPPSSTSAGIGKNVGEDPDTTRSDEIVGYVIIEEGHDNISDIFYDAQLSADQISGTGNGQDTTSFTQSFTTAPQILLAGMAGMDGANGGWAIAYGTHTTSTAYVSVEEDQIADTETTHTNEQLFILAFETPGSYIYNSAPIISNETLSHIIADPETTVVLNVTVEDEQGFSTIDYVNATITYPNTTTKNISFTQVAQGQDITSTDQESSTILAEGLPAQAIGETGILTVGPSWSHVTTTNTYTDPLVYVFSRNQSDISGLIEEALAIVANVTSTGFEVAVVAPNGSLVAEDVNYLVMERGEYNVSGTIIQAGSWSYTGTSFITKTFDTAFHTIPTVYMQIQNQSTPHWYTGRYTDTSLTTSSIDIQFEDAVNSFSGTEDVAYLAFSQGTSNSLFEGNIELAISEDPPSAWRPITFTEEHNQPIFFGILSESGGDPTKLGIGSLTSTGVNVRTTEDTYSDAEQNHAVNDALWMVFNGSQVLYDSVSVSDNEAERTIATYSSVLPDAINLLSSVNIELNITTYNTTGSQANNNANPRLELYLDTSTGWKSIGEKPLLGTGSLTWESFDNDILTDWLQTEYRSVQVAVTHIDYNDTGIQDIIAWDDVFVTLQGGNATSTWRTQITDTYDMGLYNITAIHTSDTLDAITETYTNLTFTIADISAPTFTYLENQTFGDTEPVDITFTAYDYSGIDTWTINDTRFDITSSGHLSNTTTLLEGIYDLIITVNDTYGNQNSNFFFVNITSVPDTTSPLFTPALTNITLAYGSSLYYDINATDDRGRLDIFTVNDSNYVIDEETGELTNSSDIPIGITTLAITVNDTSGNENTSNFEIIVLDVTPPQITVLNQTVEYGDSLSYQVQATDESGIDSYWLVGTTDFTISATGLLSNTSELILDNIYPFYIHVNDTVGNEQTVYFEVGVFDTSPPNAIENLTATSVGRTWINWEWDEPTGAGISYVIVYLDNQPYQNISTTSLNVTNLSVSSTYAISIQAVDGNDNINLTWRNDTTSTLDNQVPTATYIPANNTYLSEEPTQISVTTNDSDDIAHCVEIETTGQGYTGLLYKNCSITNATTDNFIWTVMPTPTNGQTQVLWHFDNLSTDGENDTQIVDYVGGEETTTCTTSCPSWTQEGKLGGAFLYTGAEQWSLEQPYFNVAFTEKTFQAWIKPTTTAGTHTIYEEGGSTNGFGLRLNAGVLEFATRDSTTQTTISTAYIDTNQWHAVTAIFNNSNMTLYIDGLQVATTTTTYSTISAHSDFGGLGATTGSDAFAAAAGNYYYGYIDEVHITDSTLTEEEIQGPLSIPTGEYDFTITISDGFNTTTYNSINITKDSEAPIISTNGPQNNYTNFTSPWDDITFDCNATDNYQIANITLHITNASNESFTLNQTTPTILTTVSEMWVLNITEGNYTWSCAVTDAAGTTTWGENRSLFIEDRRDLIAPDINEIWPKEDTLYNVTQTVTLQANVTDNKNINTVYVNITLPNSTQETIELTQYLTTDIYNESWVIPIHIGTYNLTYYVNDSEGNFNTTTSNFTARYGGYITTGETSDPTENGVPFTYFVDYTYANGTPIENASCTMNLQSDTYLSYFFTPAERYDYFNESNKYGAVTLESVGDNNSHTDYKVRFHLAYNGTENTNFNVWLRQDETTWDSVQIPDAIINKSSYPTLNETLQEYVITFSNDKFPTFGNYTLIYGCDNCNNSDYYIIGADEDNFGHSYTTTSPSATWSNMTDYNYEYMVEFQISSIAFNLTYNDSTMRYEQPSVLYLTKNTTYVFDWEVNCSKPEHDNQTGLDNITLRMNYIPQPEILSINENPSELGDEVTIQWTNDHTDQAFGFYDSYVNLTYDNGTFIQQFNGSPFDIPFVNVPFVGDYNMTAYAENSQGSATATTNFTVHDTTPPSVTTIEPVTGTTYYPQTIYINATVTDIQAVDTVFANITWLSSSQLIELTDLDNNTIYSSTFDATEITNYTITIVTNDTDNNINNTEAIIFTIKDNVYGEETDIITNMPNASVYLNETRINTTHYYTGLYNVTVYANDTLVASFWHNFAQEDLNLSIMNAYVYTDGGIAYSEEGRENITLYVPLQGISCRVTICEDVNDKGSCTMGNARYEEPSIQGIYCPVLVNGTYGQDDLDKSDFIVTIDDIIVNPTTPIEGINVSINVSVENIGETWSENVTVLLWDRSTNVLLENYTITNFTVFETENFLAWNVFDMGPHELFVTIDPQNEFTELNETNNNISTWYNVSGWFTLYGNVTLNLSLAGSDNEFYSWNASEYTGNIYVVDADATIEWDSLQSLGRTGSGVQEDNDFAEADAYLNLSTHQSSIASRYTSDGFTPHTTNDTLIYGQLVENIPYAQSTNNTNFQTGILWDTSDDVDNTFDATDAEDLIFFTHINQQQTGAYGTYDYELTFPAGLQDTEGVDESTYIYIEIT